MAIRPLRANEIDRLIILWKEFMNDPSAIDQLIPTHDENTKRMTEYVSKLVEEDPKQILVAEEGGNWVGYVMFQRQSKTTALETRRTWAYVSDLYVRPSHRRRGIGKSLLQACLDDLRSSGTTHVRLGVWSKNEGAMRLYRRVGFKDYMLIMEAEIQTTA